MTFHDSTSITINYSEPLWISGRFIDTLTHPANAYSHQSRMIGGYWSAKISINDRQEKIEDWIQDGLGRHIQTYNPALVAVWEGFVNKITATLGALQFQVGPLLDIGNRVSVVYSEIDTSTDPPTLGIRTETGQANNTDSQDLYGIIHKKWGINGATLAQAEQLRDGFVNDPNRALPSTSRDSNLSGNSEPRVELECLGYWHWLKAYYYTNAATGTVNLSTKIQDVRDADPNSIFSSDNSQITSNTFQVKDGYDGNETAEVVMKRLNSFGDVSDNPYLLGFYADRILEYQQVPTTIEYQQQIGDNIGIVDANGNEVKPWDVLPGKWLFYPDFLVGRNVPISASTLGLDPRAGLIEVVKFNAPYGLSVNGQKLSQLDQALAKRGIGGVG